MKPKSTLKSKNYFVLFIVTAAICSCLYGCSRAVIEPQPSGESSKKIIEQQDKQKIIKPDIQTYEYKNRLQTDGKSTFKKPIDYFGGKTPSYPLHKLTSESYYPDFARDIHGKAGLKRALKQSIIYYNRVPKKTKFYFGDDQYDAAFMRLSANKFLEFLNSSPSNKAIRNFIYKNYNVYTTVRRDDSKVASIKPISKTKQLSNSYSQSMNELQSKEIDLSVLFTGYYEPSLKGSLVKGGEYIYPIYSKPDDLIEVPRGGFSGIYKGTPASGARRNEKNELVPYYTRAEIDAMPNFEKHAKPIAWVNSRIDRFFLEIQGSGRIDLKEGGTIKVQYNSKNGRPYRSIGKYLVDKGVMAKEDVTMQSLRKWLDDNPSRVDEVLNHNLSFVFFRKGEGGPVGCLGVEVTRMRSIATDTALFPKGALCFMDTTIPTWDSREGNVKWQNYAAFVLNQDTGGAIKGSGRADYFYGHGKYAELAAGYMKQMGRLYFLVLKK
ncbi:MAG: MltA domain-containing protein [Desulfamplus sp.]|nr:MltA domain-containing protein [Desulfamplus sp.]